jgi:hypothetical protein
VTTLPGVADADVPVLVAGVLREYGLAAGAAALVLAVLLLLLPQPASGAISATAAVASAKRYLTLPPLADYGVGD